MRICFLKHHLLYVQGSVYLQNRSDKEKRLREWQRVPPALEWLQHVAARKISKALGKERHKL